MFRLRSAVKGIDVPGVVEVIAGTRVTGALFGASPVLKGGVS